MSEELSRALLIIIIPLIKINSTIFMKKVFIIKSQNLVNEDVKDLSSYAYKDYRTAVDDLKEMLIAERYELQQSEYDNNTDMTEIVKGFIEVYETKKGQKSETFSLNPIKTYNYNF